MAEIVAGIGVPHTPAFPALVAKQGPDCETARLYAEIAEQARSRCAGRADHLHRRPFQYVLPGQFSDLRGRHRGDDVGPERPDADAALQGRRCRPHSRPISVRPRSRAASIISLVQDFDVDHATMVPLHFLDAAHENPGRADLHQRARAAAARARSAAMRSARPCAQPSRTGRSRCASRCIGSGSFSLEIGGPKIPPGERAGTPDPEWAEHVQDLMEHARIERPARRGDDCARCCRPAISAANCSTGSRCSA